MSKTKPERDKTNFEPLSSTEFERKAKRIKRARELGDRGFWQNLGLVGSIGWMVILPAVGGGLLGNYIDGKRNDPLSWSLTLVVVGLATGCYTAWRNIREER